MTVPDKRINLGHIAEHPDVLIGTRYEQKPPTRHGIVVHAAHDRTYVAVDALLGNEAIKLGAISLTSGWHGCEHPCAEKPCVDCRADAERAIRGAVDALTGGDHGG